MYIPMALGLQREHTRPSNHPHTQLHKQDQKSTEKSPPTTTVMNATSCHCPTTNSVLAFDAHVTRFFLLLIHYILIGAISVAAMEFWSAMVRANLARSPERRAFLFRGMGY
ncbi:hypothetical protein Vi05172_g12656 [Venturia inaequalis]|nr:hypothetical protein Vi05172_g12656 [Venturia inaequalis]